MNRDIRQTAYQRGPSGIICDVTRWWDSDKAIARGAAPGTRGGRAIRLQSRPPSRDISTEGLPDLDPPRDALAVFRPRLSLFRPRQWIAVTPLNLEARAGGQVAVLRRSEVHAIHIVRHGQMVFAGAGGRRLAAVAPVYTGAQLRALAALLGVRVVDQPRVLTIDHPRVLTRPDSDGPPHRTRKGYER